MKPLITFIFIIIITSSCSSPLQKVKNDDPELFRNNLLKQMDANSTGELQWMNSPLSVNNYNSLQIEVDKGTDFFNNPEDGSVISTAPYLYKEIEGNFVATALVRPNFNSLWNAVALMVHFDENNWIKFGFENSDATGNSIVSVVTKQLSDDANGVILNNYNEIWLKIIRKGDIYSMHWSADGKNYKMVRLTKMPTSNKVKIGIEAQSPVGESVTHEVLYFGIEKTTVEDMRKGK